VDGQTLTKPVALSGLINLAVRGGADPNLTTGWHQPADVLQSWWEQTSGVTPSLGKDPARPRHADAPYSGLESQYGVICSDSPIRAARDRTRHRRSSRRHAPAQSAVLGLGDRAVRAMAGAGDGPVHRTVEYAHRAPDPGRRQHSRPGDPYQDSIAMAHDLADARLLTVNGYGHTALANPSSCVNQFEVDYFVTGALPPPGTVCQQDRAPFAADGIGTGPGLHQRCF